MNLCVITIRVRKSLNPPGARNFDAINIMYLGRVPHTRVDDEGAKCLQDGKYMRIYYRKPVVWPSKIKKYKKKNIRV